MIHTNIDHTWLSTDLSVTLQQFEELFSQVLSPLELPTRASGLHAYECVDRWLMANYQGSELRIHHTLHGSIMLDGIRFSNQDQKMRFILERM